MLCPHLLCALAFDDHTHGWGPLEDMICPGFERRMSPGDMASNNSAVWVSDNNCDAVAVVLCAEEVWSNSKSAWV